MSALIVATGVATGALARLGALTATSLTRLGALCLRQTGALLATLGTGALGSSGRTVLPGTVLPRTVLPRRTVATGTITARTVAA